MFGGHTHAGVHDGHLLDGGGLRKHRELHLCLALRKPREFPGETLRTWVLKRYSPLTHDVVTSRLKSNGEG